MKSIVLLLSFVGIYLVAMAGRAEAAIIMFSGTLSGAQEVPANGSLGTGSFTLTLDNVANTLGVNVTFSGLTGTTTAAHIHGPAAAGVNTSVLLGLTGFPTLVTTGSYTNTFSGISSTTQNHLLAGLTYVNIHTSAFAGGEIRGQAGVPEPASFALWGLGALGCAIVGYRRRKSA